MKRLAATTWKVLALGVFGYCVLVLALVLGQRNALYHPNDIVPDPARYGVAEMSARRIETADGLKPLAWWAPPREAGRPVIVYFHGNGGHLGSRAGRARLFLDAGYGVLLAGYRYNAGAGGAPSEAGLIADGHAALAFVLSQGIPTDQIVLYGESLGTGIATAVAADQPVGGVVLEKPYSSIADVAQDIYWYAPARWLVWDKFDSMTRITRLRAPILVVHGENDTLIPVRFARKLFDAAPAPKEGHFLPGGTHGNLYRLGAGQLVLDFIGRNVAG